LLALRATRVFEAVLLLLARFRTLDEEAAFVVRFAFVFAVEAAPVFFVFGVAVFLDFLRATIVNLSTRKLFRTRYRSAHEYCSNPCSNVTLGTAKRPFVQENHLRLRQDASRLPLDD
jgi:hypothetical protein